LGYEIQAIIAINLGEIQYSVHVIMASLELIIFTVTLGFCISICIKISELIVKEPVRKIFDTIKISFIFAAFNLILVVCFFYYFRDFIIFLFAPNNEIYELGVDVLRINCIYCLINFIFFYINHTLRGFNYQIVPTIFFFCKFLCNSNFL